MDKEQKILEQMQKLEEQLKEERQRKSIKYFNEIKKYKLDNWNFKTLQNALKFISDSGESEFTNKGV